MMDRLAGTAVDRELCMTAATPDPRTRLFALLTEMGFEPVDYDINHRYRAGMEVVARKRAGKSESGSEYIT
jgi:hypothetical protein